MFRLMAMLLWVLFVLSGGEAQAFFRCSGDRGVECSHGRVAERHGRRCMAVRDEKLAVVVARVDLSDERGTGGPRHGDRTIGAAPDDSDPVIPGQGFLYAYDGLGNRTSATRGGGGTTADATLTYSPAASNQYTSTASNRTGIVTGSADPAASVAINSSPAPRSGPWFGQSKSTTAGTTAAWLTFSIDATLAGITDHTDSALLIPPSTLAPVCDADGNLTDDGLRTFIWDAENRLLSATSSLLDYSLLPPTTPLVIRSSFILRGCPGLRVLDLFM